MTRAAPCGSRGDCSLKSAVTAAPCTRCRSAICWKGTSEITSPEMSTKSRCSCGSERLRRARR
eukprot:3164452-Pleurochrysis_carterae.AAC.1